jgi:hypothetical protein
MASTAGTNASPDASQAITIATMLQISKSRAASKITRQLKDWLKGDKSKRTSMIGSNDSVAGSFYLRRFKNSLHVKSLLCVNSIEEVESDDKNKPSVRRIYGTMSNNIRSSRPTIFTEEFLDEVLVVTDSHATAGNFNHGLKVPANPGNKTITDAIPLLANNNGCLVYVPKTILFGFDPNHELPQGPLDQSTIDTLEDLGAVYKQWAAYLAAYDPAHAAFVKVNILL